jgi:hypothetical protein
VRGAFPAEDVAGSGADLPAEGAAARLGGVPVIDLAADEVGQHDCEQHGEEEEDPPCLGPVGGANRPASQPMRRDARAETENVWTLIHQSRRRVLLGASSPDRPR